MNRRSWVGAFALALALVPGPVSATGLNFGILGKSVDDANFVDAWRGCADAARKSGDSCVHLGAAGAAQSRLQVLAIQDALASGDFDALAISVINSALVARAVAPARVPVITFDSPFDAAHDELSRSYVGIDNLAFGQALGRLARRFKPTGGTICLMTAAQDPNLTQRVWGVRQVLSGDARLPMGQRLNGEGGWFESARCPWNSGDSNSRTMAELALTLSVLKPDVFLSVGHWPVIDPVAFRATVEPFREALTRRERVVIAAVGKITPDMERLMSDRLVHGYVSVNFYETGRLAYRTMKQLVEGLPVPGKVDIPSTVRPAR